MATPIVAFGIDYIADFVTSIGITGQDVGSGSNRAAYVLIGATNTGDDPVSVSVGSDSLTAQGTVYTDGNGWKWRLYAGALTVSGSQTINATWDDTGKAKIIVGVVMPDVDTGVLIEDLTSGEGGTSSLDPTWTIDSSTGDTVVALMCFDSAATNTPTSPAVALTGTGLGGSVRQHGMYEAGATSVTIDSDTASANVWRGFAFNVPAGGGGGDASATGVTLTAAASLLAGSASGSASATASGVTLTAAASLIAGAASGVVNGTLNFQAAGMEFGARTGLGINTFALDAGVSYRYTIHADGLTLGAPLHTSAAITLDSAGKLPNYVGSAVAPGTTYRVFAIRQSDGEAATFRMEAS